MKKKLGAILLALVLAVGLAIPMAMPAAAVDGAVTNYAFVPNAEEASVSKVDLTAVPPAEIARYSTVEPRGSLPYALDKYRVSRLAMDSGGNAWALNSMTGRDYESSGAQGSVARISGGPVAGETPGVDTSNTGGLPGIVSNDVRVTYFNLGNPGECPRTINIVEEGGNLYLWIGFYMGMYFQKYQYDPVGNTLTAVTDEDIDVSDYTPYTAAIDGNGILWGVSRDASPYPGPDGQVGVFCFDTNNLAGGVTALPYDLPGAIENNPYAIMVKSDGTVWVSDGGNWGTNRTRYFAVYTPGDPLNTTTVAYVSTTVSAKGMRGFMEATDGSIWATSIDGKVIQLTETASWVGAVMLSGLGELTGIGSDAAGYFWVIRYGSDQMSRFDPTLTALIPVDASVALGDGPYAYGGFIQIATEELTVTKTAVTSYTRTHDWSIDKKVETELGHTIDGEEYPKIWLYVDGSGDETATWTIDVTYEGYEDSDFNVSGTITIENTGETDALITGVVDELAGTPITVDWAGATFPYALDVGETLTGTYSEDGYVEGSNEVTVTTERDEYGASADIVWGDPTTEDYATVTVKDISDLFGEVELGTVTAPNDAQFTYDKDFAWGDYGADNCGAHTYVNTATIVEPDVFAEATLKVNVQCYIYETAYAKGDEAKCFIPTFANWGWTNPIPSLYGDTWELWAGAAKCDTSKGTLVGSVDVVYDGVNVTVTYNVAFPLTLEETHVYAGTTMFPQVQRGKKTNDTVAPGQYYNAGPFDGGQVYVIAHAVVGIPDPDFGP